MSPPRALILVCLSRFTDATTKPDRQLAKCRELIARRGTQARKVWLRQIGFRVVWTPHSEGNKTVDDFKLEGDLTMDLDADQFFGPMPDIVTALSGPKIV